MFAWCSLDPITRQVAPYPEKQSLMLESALRSGQSHATIMVQPATMDHGLVAIVTFNDPVIGQHTQRTLAGTGERPVRRTDTLSVTFGESEEYKLPEAALASFGRMAWVSVEPVTGVLQPYSAANALIIEQSFHQQERRVSIVIALPSGAHLNVEVLFDYVHGNHKQSTGTGLRSVSRVAAKHVPLEGLNICLYRLPENGTSDSRRYRLSATSSSENVGMVVVPEEVFMEESQLAVEAFSSVKLMENALLEMGYDTSTLNDVASFMKEEPMRLAANVCLKEYQNDSEVALLTLIDEILREWERHRIVFRSPPRCMIAEAGIQTINGLFTCNCQHNGKLMYQQVGGEAIVYFDECWKINDVSAVDSWCYVHPDSTQALPPIGVWATQASPDKGDPTSLETPPLVALQPQEVLAELSMVDNPEEFAASAANLFSNWDVDHEELTCLLCRTRGGHTKIMLRKVAASSLWRTVMQGA